MIGLIAKPWPMTVSAATAGIQPAFPAVNSTNNDYGRVTVMSPASQYAALSVTYDLGAVLPVDVLGVLWHNLPAGCSIQFEGYDAPGNPLAIATAGPAWTGGTYRDRLSKAKHLTTLNAPALVRFVKVTAHFNGLPVPGDAYLFSRVFIGLGAKFKIGFQKAVLSAKDMNAKVTTEVGEDRSQEDPSLIRPVISLSLEYAKQSEMEQVLGQYTLGLGVSKPLLVCTDLTTPTLQDNVAFGRPDKVIALESSIYDVWSFEAVVTSLGV